MVTLASPIEGVLTVESSVSSQCTRPESPRETLARCRRARFLAHPALPRSQRGCAGAMAHHSPWVARYAPASPQPGGLGLTGAAACRARRSSAFLVAAPRAVLSKMHHVGTVRAAAATRAASASTAALV